jgi:hypothetical protein
VRIQAGQALIVQGSLKGGVSERTAIKVDAGQPVDIVAVIDLPKQQVTMTANDVTIQAKLEQPLESITHIGYAVDNAQIDFTPIEIEIEVDRQ